MTGAGRTGAASGHRAHSSGAADVPRTFGTTGSEVAAAGGVPASHEASRGAGGCARRHGQVRCALPGTRKLGNAPEVRGTVSPRTATRELLLRCFQTNELQLFVSDRF